MYRSVAVKDKTQVYVCEDNHRTIITGIYLPGELVCPNVRCLKLARKVGLKRDRELEKFNAK
jgi:hypothetical protein